MGGTLETEVQGVEVVLSTMDNNNNNNINYE